jgi:hypothetical protein
MSIELRCIKKLGALRPASDHDAELMNGLPEGMPIKLVATIHPRNPKAHAWFFGLLGVVAQNTEYTTDQLLTLIKIGIGHVDTLIMPSTGEVIYQPRSIAWSKMDEKQFRPFVEKSIDFIITRILPGSTSAELEREVFERLGIDLNSIHESGAPGGAAGQVRTAGRRAGHASSSPPGANGGGR